MRRFLFITLIIIIALIAGFLIYWWTQQVSQPLITEESQDNINEIRNSLVQQETDYEVIAYWFNNEGRLYTVKPTGEIVGVTTQQVEGLHEASPSPDGQKVLINFNYPDQPILTIFDFQEESWSPLPKEAIAASWHPQNSKEVAYLSGEQLRIWDTQNKKSRPVMEILLMDVILEWVAPEEIIVSDRPSAFSSSESWRVNIKNKTIVKLENNPLVLLPKCVSRENDTYCAIPKEIAEGAVMPDDYLKKKYLSEDDFYKNDKIFYESKSELIDAVNLIINNDKLYFINRWDQRIYSLSLPIKEGE